MKVSPAMAVFVIAATLAYRAHTWRLVLFVY
jgi:hypothetical protein